MIKEDYVSFETSKLLKEKGFDEKCHRYWQYDKANDKDDVDGIWLRCCDDVFELNNSELDTLFEESLLNFGYSAPTLQMVMKWLREVHDLHIIAYPWKADREERATHWCCRVYKSFNLLGYEKYTNETPKSYEEACEIAIKYCLEKLI